jgi:hypothetical protein
MAAVDRFSPIPDVSVRRWVWILGERAALPIKDDELRIRLTKQIHFVTDTNAAAHIGVSGQRNVFDRAGSGIVSMENAMNRTDPDESVGVHAHRQKPIRLQSGFDGDQIENRSIVGPDLPYKSAPPHEKNHDGAQRKVSVL